MKRPNLYLTTAELRQARTFANRIKRPPREEYGYSDEELEAREIAAEDLADLIFAAFARAEFSESGAR